MSIDVNPVLSRYLCAVVKDWRMIDTGLTLDWQIVQSFMWRCVRGLDNYKFHQNLLHCPYGLDRIGDWSMHWHWILDGKLMWDWQWIGGLVYNCRWMIWLMFDWQIGRCGGWVEHLSYRPLLRHFGRSPIVLVPSALCETSVWVDFDWQGFVMNWQSCEELVLHIVH